MGYNNYGRRGGRNGGGGPRFQPKPRPVLSSEHDLHPTIEACAQHEGRQQLRDFASRGSESSRDTIIIDGDPNRTTMLIPIAAMYSEMQFGIPPHHPDFPALMKLDTRHESNQYYAVYSSPIMWEHNADGTDFRHIPCFTRYVIDTHGRVLNAYNGREITRVNDFLIELVADGRQNEPKKVSMDFIKALAFLPLPKKFIDFGYRIYSHQVGVDVHEGQYGWMEKDKVKVKNNDTGMVGEYDSMSEFVKREVSDFELMKELGKYTWAGLKGQIVNVGPFTMKESVPKPEVPAIPSVEKSQPTAQANTETTQTSVPETKDLPADDNFDFPDDF